MEKIDLEQLSSYYICIIFCHSIIILAIMNDIILYLCSVYYLLFVYCLK